MRIAVTHENGQVFQHFGHTEEFKIYEIEDGKVLYSEVIDSNGSGHGALAGLLDDNAISVLICGGIGGGAQNALSEYGIEVISGVSGNTDEAVEAYLQGQLVSAGVNCDHHDHENGGHCGHHGHEEGEELGCGGGCGGCGGGCGAAKPAFEGKNVGKAVKVHYRGTFNDGTQFDSSYDRGQTLDFVCGAGMMILGFDKAVANMEVGQEIDVHLMPEEAYGPKDPNAIIKVTLEELGGGEDLNVDDHVMLQNIYGQPFEAVVIEKTETTITFDANSEMAGKELNFHIELVSVEE